jgi:hypothetical protein
MNNSDRYRWLKAKDPEALCRIAAAAGVGEIAEIVEGNVDAMIDAAMAEEQARSLANDGEQQWQ